jgi:MFS family permease
VRDKGAVARGPGELDRGERLGHRADLIQLDEDRVGDALAHAGTLLFGVAYLLLAATGPSVALILVGFVVAGVAIGCAETAEHAAVATLAPADLRGSAFGLLAAVQSFGNLAASAIAGLLWTLVSPEAAFIYAAAWMALALAIFARLRLAA